MRSEKIVNKKYSEWLESGLSGASAKTIASVMLGDENKSISYPRDSGDFGRCMNLLSYVPEWRGGLSKMASCPSFHGEIWAAIVDAWPALEDMHNNGKDDDLTVAIKNIVEPIEKKSGKVTKLGANVSIQTPVSMSASDKKKAENLIDKEAARVEEKEKQTIPGLRRNIGGNIGEQLRSIVARIERLEEERAGISSDIKDIYAEAKGNGYDVKTLRKIVQLRKLGAAEREEAEHLLDIYKRALGMAPELDEEEEYTPISGKEDEDYITAKEIVIRDRKASTSYLQRMMKTGFNHAARLIDRMESEGVVSAANHLGKREVLQPPPDVA